MYHRTHWLDHVTDQNGAVIQQGTLQDQAHFNNMEVGIADANFAAQVLTEGYLQLRADSWMDEYMPEEKPKLTAAEVKTSGNYVMYCILSDTDKSAAFGAFESSLK